MIGVTLKGIVQTRKALDILIKSTSTAVKAEIKRAATSMVKTAQGISPEASGRLKHGIDVIFYRDGLEAIVSPSAPYAKWVEGYESGYQFGRRPGGMPPDDAILRWMSIRGIPAKALFPIQRKIALEGTKAQPFMKPSYDAEVAKFEATMDRIFEQAVTQVLAVKGPPT